MSTTLIFAEFLSIGALTLIAIALLAVGVGLEPTALLALFGDGQVVGVTLALAMAYPRAAVAWAFSASMWNDAIDSLATTPRT